MSRNPNMATLLIFTLGPDRERDRRRLLPARLGKLELNLHRQGLEAALTAGQSCGCRVEVSAPEPLELPPGIHRRQQRGRTFGERLSHALGDVRRGGSAGAAMAPVVVVGSDVPGLRPEHLRHALARLDEDENRVVVGPSPDGGFYLLASRKPIEGLLAGVRWRRRDALASLLGALAAAGRPVTLLPPVADLDRRSDLERWLSATGGLDGVWRRLCGRLRSALADLRRPKVARRLGSPLPVAPSARGARAPPA